MRKVYFHLVYFNYDKLGAARHLYVHCIHYAVVFYVFTGRYQRGSRSLAYNLANPFSQEQVVYEVTSSLKLAASRPSSKLTCICCWLRFVVCGSFPIYQTCSLKGLEQSLHQSSPLL